jgi:hypothetical protein
VTDPPRPTLKNTGKPDARKVAIARELEEAGARNFRADGGGGFAVQRGSSANGVRVEGGCGRRDLLLRRCSGGGGEECG